MVPAAVAPFRRLRRERSPAVALLTGLRRPLDAVGTYNSLVEQPADTERKPCVWVGRSELVYVGPALGVRPHSTAVPRILLGLDAPFRLDRDGEISTSWCTYVPPRVRHQVLSPGLWWAVAYLEPGSHRDLICRASLPDPVLLAERLRHGSGAGLLAALGPDGRPSTRLSPVLEHILSRPGSSMPAEQAAALSMLSLSQFLHEFSQTTGTSYRRFRQWARLLEATRRHQDAPLTAIATAAGFASPSHFSDTVRATFGFTASELLATGALIEDLAVPADEPRARGGRRRPG